MLFCTTIPDIPSATTTAIRAAIFYIDKPSLYIGHGIDVPEVAGERATVLLLFFGPAFLPRRGGKKRILNNKKYVPSWSASVAVLYKVIGE